MDSMSNITTHQAAELFDVTAQTIRRWVDEFSKYLSPSARPEQGRSRILTESDLDVLALIYSMKGQGKLFEDIHAALSAGQRGEAPSNSLTATPENSEQNALFLRLQDTLMQMNAQLDDERKKRLEAEIGRAYSEGRESILREMLDKLEKEVASLRQSPKLQNG